MTGGCVHDQFDVTLEDQELLDEVELTTSLIIAASESDMPLSQAQIDEILGVTPEPEPAPAPDAEAIPAPSDPID